MRIVLATILSIFALSVPLAAAQQEGAASLRTAERNLEIAHLQLKQFIRVDYPLELRRLDSEIKMSEAEINSLLRRLDEFGSFHRHTRYSRPFFTTVEDQRLLLLAAELRRSDLRKKKCLMQQSYQDRKRLLELQVEAAAETLEALGGEVRRKEPPRIRTPRIRQPMIVGGPRNVVR